MGSEFGFSLTSGREGCEVCVKTGADLWVVVEMRAAPMVWDGEAATLVSIRDITQRKQDAEEKELLRQQLIQAQKMEGLGTLASGIAHDFNNYLAGIFGYTELALEKIQNGQDNSYELTRVLAASNRARNLVRQVLTFSRRIKGTQVKLDLNARVLDSVGLLRNTLPRMLEIDLSLMPDLWPVKADPGQMEQVILNLATNARDAMPGGGRLTVATYNRRVENAYCHACGANFYGDYVMLHVGDTGCGMDEETSLRVFDPFFTTKEAGKGTGLGLSTVFGIVAAHGGHITVETSLGKGATISVYLPVVQAGAISGDAPREERPASLPVGKESILLVDDEQSVRDVVERMLVSLGYQVEAAATGEEALEFLGRRVGEFSLVLLDINMPGMGGVKTLAEILRRHPGLKVVVISGYVTRADVDLVLAAGASSYLDKPFLQADLARTVREVLDQTQ